MTGDTHRISRIRAGPFTFPNFEIFEEKRKRGEIAPEIYLSLLDFAYRLERAPRHFGRGSIMRNNTNATHSDPNLHALIARVDLIEET